MRLGRYAAFAHLASMNFIIWALLIGILRIASIDVVVDALMVEEGQAFGLINQFQGQSGHG